MSRRKSKNKDAAILRAEQEILHIEEALLRETRETHRDVERIERFLHPKRATQSIKVSFSGASAMNTLNLNVGQSSIGTITPLSADGVTPSGGVVSNATFSIPPDPSFTAVDNSDGTVTITGVAVSAAPVTGTANATVTDTDGAVSTFSASFTITVATGTVTPPTATTASIGVAFSTPS